MITLSSLQWRRPFFVALLVVMANTIWYSLAGAGRSDFLIFTPGMLFSALGLALGSHLIIRDRVPPSLGRLIGAALTGGLAGALLFLAGFATGTAMADLSDPELRMGLGWAGFFFPFWIFFSGGSAIFGRYLTWRLLGNQMVVATGGGALGALVGDTVMTFTIFWPFAVGPDYLHAPVAMTAMFGALVAAGLAWAERMVPHETLKLSDVSSADDIKPE